MNIMYSDFSWNILVIYVKYIYLRTPKPLQNVSVVSLVFYLYRKRNN